MGTACVNIDHPEFKRLASKFDLSDGSLENITYEYRKSVGDAEAFPTDSFIRSRIEGSGINAVIDPKSIEFWKQNFADPKSFNTLDLAKEYKQKLTKFFSSDAIIIRQTKRNGTFDVHVKLPTWDKKYEEKAKEKAIADLAKSINAEEAIARTCAEFLENFGISINDLANYKGDVPIFDSIEKLINAETASDIIDATGYTVAFMMQWHPEMVELVSLYERTKDKLAAKGLRRHLSKNLDAEIELSIKATNYKKLNKEESLQEIGLLIADELRNFYNMTPTKDTKETNGFFAKLWEVISAFFERLNPISRASIERINTYPRVIAASIVNNDSSIILRSNIKPESRGKEASLLKVNKAFKDNPYEVNIIRNMTSEGIGLAGSTSMSVQGTVYRPLENPLHDIDFYAPKLSTIESVKEMLNRHYPNNEYIRSISNQEGECHTFLILDRPFIIERGESSEGIAVELLKDPTTKEVLGSYINSDLTILKPGVKGKFLDFFVGEGRYPNLVPVEINNEIFLMSDAKSALLFKVQVAREKDLWDYARFVSSNKPASAMFNRDITDFISSLRDRKLIHAYNPSLGEEDKKAYYITKGDGTYSIQSKIRAIYASLRDLNLPANTVSLKRTKSGNAIRISFNLPTDTIESEEFKDLTEINKVISFLTERFPRLQGKVHFVTLEEAKKTLGRGLRVGENSFVKDGEVYLVGRRFTRDIAIEECLHPFIATLEEDNPLLFNSLYEEALVAFPALAARVRLNYPQREGFTEFDRKNELITQALARYFRTEFTKTTPESRKTFRDLVERFISWFKTIFYRVNPNTGNTLIDLDGISPRMSLKELAQLINSADTEFSTGLDTRVRFNRQNITEIAPKEAEHFTERVINAPYYGGVQISGASILDYLNTVAEENNNNQYINDEPISVSYSEWKTLTKNPVFLSPNETVTLGELLLEEWFTLTNEHYSYNANTETIDLPKDLYVLAKNAAKNIEFVNFLLKLTYERGDSVYLLDELSNLEYLENLLYSIGVDFVYDDDRQLEIWDKFGNPTYTEETSNRPTQKETKVRSDNQKFQSRAAKLVEQLNALTDNDLISNSEVRHIAEQTVYFISDSITQFQENPEEIFNIFPDLLVVNGKQMTDEERKAKINELSSKNRVDLIRYITLDRLLSFTKERLFSPSGNPSINNIDLIDKADLIRDNFDAILTLANDAFLTVEDFSIVMVDNTPTIIEDLNPSFEDFDNNTDADIILENEGSLQEHWQIESRTQDVLLTMSKLVKQALNKCYQLQWNDTTKTYDKVPSEFGIAERINAKDATSSILRWTRGATNLEEMIALLELKVKESPWVIQIVNKLKDRSGKEADFQSQFYGVFAKAFQSYSIVLREKQDNGEYIYKSIVVNEHPALNDAAQSVAVLYKTGMHPMFDGNKVKEKELDTFSAIVNDLVNRRKSPLEENNIEELVTLITNASGALGYTIDEGTVRQALDSNESFYKMVDALYYIEEDLAKSSSVENYDPFKFRGEHNISGNLKSFLTPLTSKLEDTAVSSFFDSGKMYQSYVTPSYLTVFMNHMTSNDESFKDFIESEFGQYEWFKNPEGEWRLGWLGELTNLSQEERKDLFKHKVQLNFNKHNYMRNMTDSEYTLSVLTEYFSESNSGTKFKVPAWFRVPMMSNKPSSEFIKMYRYTGATMKDKLSSKICDIFMQELSRIQTVTIRDYKEVDPHYIKNFDKNGKKFMLVDFFNSYLEKEKLASTEMGQYIKRAIEEGTGSFKTDELSKLRELAKNIIIKYFDNRAETIIAEWKANGTFEAAKDISNIGRNDAVVTESLTEFIWNDAYAAMNILELMVTDPAFYADAEDLQKRLAQIHAPGIRANIEATDYNGKRVSDGKFRTILLTDFDDFTSNIKENLRVVFDRKLQDLLKEYDEYSPEYTTASATYENIISLFDEINVADAQGYSSPSSYRKKALLFGKWSKESEEIYKKLKSGEYSYTDLKTAFQPLKPFVYGQIQKPGINKERKDVPIEMSKLKVPVQFKNSEYLLIMADAILQNENTGRANLLRAVYQVMEESAETNEGAGIDTIQFESTCKSGLSGKINIKQFQNLENGEQLAKFELEKAIYKWKLYTNEDGSKELRRTPEYNTDSYVYEVPFENYAIQQEVPGHFKNHYQAHGSQTRYIIPSDLELINSRGEEVKYKFVDKGVKREISAESFKAEYEQTIAENINESIDKLIKELGIKNQYLSKKDSNIALSKILIDEILSSPRYGTDLLIACTVNEETGEFNIPLGDPIQSKRVEQLLNSIIKNRVNKQEIAGGPVVQVSNFGTSRELNIRFKKRDSDTEFLKTREEWERDKEGYTTFKEYIEENQGGIAYYEVFVSIYSNDLFSKFADEKGNIDIEAIEEVNPDLLKMIGYRIPTEDKYSIAPLKIVGFLPREAGDGIMLPNDITLLTGSDFDVDKFYLMRKEYTITKDIDNKELQEKLIDSLLKRGIYKNRRDAYNEVDAFMDNPMSKSADSELRSIYLHYGLGTEEPTSGTAYRNNKIIDMTWAVLTEETTADKMLNPGGFEPEKKMGYMVAAASERGNKVVNIDPYEEWKSLSNLKTKELKGIYYKNKNLCFIDTHIQFYRQNSAAATALGMAAVQKIAHAVLEGDGYQLDIDSICGLKEDETFTIAGKEFKGMMVIDSKYNDNGGLIGRTLGELVAMFADAVKDPVANLMNINSTTMPILTTLIRLGMPFEDAALFLSQPIISEVLADYTRGNISGFTKLTTIIENKKKGIQRDNNFDSKSIINTLNDVTKEELISRLFGKGDIVTDYKVLKFLEYINYISQAMKAPTYVTRFNSISNAVGPLVVDNLIMWHKISDSNFNNFYNANGDSADFLDIVANHPILGAFESTLNIADEVFEDMPVNSLNFRMMLNKAPDNMQDILFGDRKLLSELSDFYQSYLLIASGAIPVDKSSTNKFQGLQYYINEFPKDFKKAGIKEDYKGNPFIDAIKLDVQKNRAVLKIDITGLTTQDKEKLSSGWVDLYKSGERGRKVAMHLFYYNFFRAGIGFSPKSFMALFPAKLKSEIPGYIDTFRVQSNKFAQDVVGKVVLDQFVRNNWGNSKLVTKIKIGDDAEAYHPIIQEGIYTFSGKEGEELVPKPYIRIKSGKGDILLRQMSANKKTKTAKYIIINAYGNNGEYFEAYPLTVEKVSIQKPLAATEQNPEAPMSTPSNSFTDNTIQTQPKVTPEQQLTRAIKIRNKLIELFMVKGRTEEEAKEKIAEFKAKTAEEKKSLSQPMKKFIAHQLELRKIKFDEKLLEEMYNELC